MARRVLVVEDDDSLRETLCLGLRRAGFFVYPVATGHEALAAFTHQTDVVLLDLMIPPPDGYSICRRLSRTSDVPIIVLTARSDPSDAVKALELGAVDYVRKPFDMNELIARIERALERSGAAEVIRLDGLEINVSEHIVRCGDGPVDVSPTEFRLLCELASSPERTMRHEVLLRRVWGLDGIGDPNVVASTVKRLRKKLGGKGAQIVSVRGVGYKWSSSANES